MLLSQIILRCGTKDAHVGILGLLRRTSVLSTGGEAANKHDGRELLLLCPARRIRSVSERRTRSTRGYSRTFSLYEDANKSPINTQLPMRIASANSSAPFQEHTHSTSMIVSTIYCYFHVYMLFTSLSFSSVVSDENTNNK